MLSEVRVADVNVQALGSSTFLERTVYPETLPVSRASRQHAWLPLYSVSPLSKDILKECSGKRPHEGPRWLIPTTEKDTSEWTRGVWLRAECAALERPQLCGSGVVRPRGTWRPREDGAG